MTIPLPPEPKATHRHRRGQPTRRGKTMAKRRVRGKHPMTERPRMTPVHGLNSNNRVQSNRVQNSKAREINHGRQVARNGQVTRIGRVRIASRRANQEVKPKVNRGMGRKIRHGEVIQVPVRATRSRRVRSRQVENRPSQQRSPSQQHSPGPSRRPNQLVLESEPATTGRPTWHNRRQRVRRLTDNRPMHPVGRVGNGADRPRVPDQVLLLVLHPVRRHLRPNRRPHRRQRIPRPTTRSRDRRPSRRLVLLVRSPRLPLRWRASLRFCTT